MDKITEVLTRGVANIIPSREALEKELRTRKLNIYLGIDPTSTRIHLGHATHLRRLQTLSKLGHKVTFLIGNFTALIGDTSDKDKERPALTAEEIENNWQTYKTQASKLIDFSKITVRHNSEWLEKLGFADTIKLTRHFSLNDFISRELIKKRLTSGGSVSLPEVLYPVMQGYDSYFLDTDLQIGGTDQTFNMQAGRTLQKDLRGKESFVLSSDFLEGTDGRKMSKSWDNAIWLDDEPNNMYGKVMSLRDELIPRYFELATNLPISTVEPLISTLHHPSSTVNNPMDLKKQLAWQIVSELHDHSVADSAKNFFESTFQQGQTPNDIPEFTVSSTNILDVLVETKLAASKSEAKRLINQGGVYFNENRISDLEFKVSAGVLQVGPRSFAKISV